MSSRALAWAWDQVPSSRPAKLVLVALADRADEDGVCWPSRRWLTAKCRPMGIDAVTRALANLADEGLILKEERLRRDDGTLSTWRIRLPLDQSAEMPTGQKRPLDPVGIFTHADSAKETLSPNGERARNQDAVWEALVSRFGEAPRSARFRGAWNAATASLRADGWDGSDPPMADLEAAYHRLYSDAALTPTALAKHYSMLAHSLAGKKRAATTACDECGLGGGHHTTDCSKVAAAA